MITKVNKSEWECVYRGVALVAKSWLSTIWVSNSDRVAANLLLLSTMLPHEAVIACYGEKPSEGYEDRLEIARKNNRSLVNSCESSGTESSDGSREYVLSNVFSLIEDADASLLVARNYDPRNAKYPTVVLYRALIHASWSAVPGISDVFSRWETRFRDVDVDRLRAALGLQ